MVRNRLWPLAANGTVCTIIIESVTYFRCKTRLIEQKVRDLPPSKIQLNKVEHNDCGHNSLLQLPRINNPKLLQKML